MDAVLEDIALALDAKAEVARIYGEEDRVDAAVMVRRNMSHSPDSPFGCTVSWGPVLPGIADGRLHICNRDSNHQGDHVCKCLDRLPPHAVG